MAQKNGNSYISETLTDSVEMPTANSGLSMTTSSIKDQPNDCDNRLPKIARLTPKASILPFPVVSHCRNRRHIRACHGRKSRTCRWHFDAICCSSTGVTISGFGGRIAISGCRSMLQSLLDTFCELALIKNPRFGVGIVVISVILSKIQVLPLWIAMHCYFWLSVNVAFLVTLSLSLAWSKTLFTVLELQ